jgi:predicted acylesterase/phospholipase RssA
MYPKRLVFSGGGTQTLVYLPALKALEEKGYLKDVKEWWGTSAGSLIAAIHAVSQSAEKAASILMKWNYTRFRDLNLLNMFQFSEVWGLDNGDCLLREIKAMLDVARTNGSSLLMSDVPGLHVVVSDITSHTTLICSHKTHPTMLVADVVRASMTLPIMICPYKCPLDNHLWVDGGIRANFPWDLIESDEERSQTLGFCMEPTWLNGVMTLNDYLISLVHFEEPAKNKEWIQRWNSNILWFPTPPYPVWYVRMNEEDYALLKTLGLQTLDRMFTTWQTFRIHESSKESSRALTSKKPQSQQQSVPPRIPEQVSHQDHTNGRLGSREYPSLPLPLGPSQDSPRQIPQLSRRWSL